MCWRFPPLELCYNIVLFTKRRATAKGNHDADTIRQIGNSKGVIIPTAMLQQVGLELEADLSVEDGALVVRAPAKSVRSGWAQASAELAKYGDDALIMPDIANEADEDLQW